MTGRQNRPPRWYVSVRSPYSWLALRDAGAYGSKLLGDSEMRVFFEPTGELASDITERSAVFHYTPMSRSKHLYILRDVARLARDRELVITWPVDDKPAWQVSAIALARVLGESQSKGKQLALALSNARWLEGRDVHNESTVRDCLVGLGLDGEIAGLHRTQEGRETGRALLKELDRDGVFGVPFLVVEREAYWGLERLSRAEKAHTSAVSPAPPPPIPLEHTNGTRNPLGDQPGGCG